VRRRHGRQRTAANPAIEGRPESGG